MGENKGEIMGNVNEFIYLWDVLIKRKWIIVSITAIATLLSFAYGIFLMTPTYDADVSIIIGKEKARYFLEDRYTSSDITLYLQVTKTYEEIAISRAVYQKTKEHLQDNDFELIKDIKAVSKPDTQVLVVTVTHPSPDKAAQYANALAENFILVAEGVFPAGELRILDKAQQPVHPTNDRKIIIIIGFILGVLVSTGITLLLEFTNKSIECERDVKKYLGVPVLGILPK
jgi:capsular polysaccharide biosynthesis protein